MSTSSISPKAINGYELLENFKVAGGGRCQWAQVRRASTTYFMKQFLSPKYPTPDSPGSPAIKHRKKELCEAFESRHVNLKKVIAEKTAPGGNLISTIDFFRNGTTYYKVTEWIPTDGGLSVSEVAALRPDNLRIFLRSVARSIEILHDCRIVHSDLKPENILIKRGSTPASPLIPKVIDFDDSYFIGDPPHPEEAVGDQCYFSPELAQYMSLAEDEDAALHMRAGMTTKSDIFSLGVIYHRYLTGQDIDCGSYNYPFEVVQHRKTLGFRPTIPPAMVAFLTRMLDQDPAKRPDIREVFKATDPDGDIGRALVASSGGTPSAKTTGGMKGIKTAPVTAPTAPTPAVAPAPATPVFKGMKGAPASAPASVPAAPPATAPPTAPTPVPAAPTPATPSATPKVKINFTTKP